MSKFSERDYLGWPEHSQFPYNFKSQTVKKVIEQDLNFSKNPLIITGYASLDKIIEFLAYRYQNFQNNSEELNEIKILLGNEPYPSQKENSNSSINFSQEVEDYWLERRISIYKFEKVIAAIEIIKLGKVKAKIAPSKTKIHAKIYKGDQAITLGSSNYSQSGLNSQIEGNVRFERNLTKEQARFYDACALAEKIWDLGRNYTEELIELLENLLTITSWQESLAKACVTLLEGEWAKQYELTQLSGNDTPLWPSQEKGIAQAIWVLENVGSVLIADATGSGKTKMGANLIKNVINKLWGSGRKRKVDSVLICPPDPVQDSWNREFIKCMGVTIPTYSYGLLSRSDSNKHDELIEIIGQCQVLAVDEAHKFLHRKSKQTQALFKNMADYVLLFTATPINRGTGDLLAIIDLLGADNFDEDTLNILTRLWKNQQNLTQIITQDNKKVLRGAIQQFTVRRTKTMLNQMIDKEPEKYKGKFGKPCRYPTPKSQTYDCNESKNDCQLAQEIQQYTKQLRGLILLRKPFKLPNSLEKQGYTEEDYLNSRLKTAPILASYQVMSCLRSSKLALLEHIHGTDKIKEKYEIREAFKSQSTGNMINTLDQISNQLPTNKLSIELPEWLTDLTIYQQVCEKEKSIYETISELTIQISNARENAKMQCLVDLSKKHKLLLAFDSRPITLLDIKGRLEQQECCEVMMATGGDQNQKKQLNEKFKLGSTASGIIALCSDAMSEGINLQEASTVVFLDRPSVIRLAEQRIGRIDRMDSPHDEIEIFWPKDSNEFAIRSSERKFRERHNLVDNLLGANIEIPEDITHEFQPESSDQSISLEEDIEEFYHLQNYQYQLGDVFDPVRSIVEGDNSLILSDVYTQIRKSRASVVTSMSLVAAKQGYPWAFFALEGTEWGAPRWVYLDDLEGKSITDLEKITQKLREHLPSDPMRIETAQTWVDYFINKLKKSEIELLCYKKQRALEQMKKILHHEHKLAIKNHDLDRQNLINPLLNHFEFEDLNKELNQLDKNEDKLSPDLSQLAEQWLNWIRPVWFERLQEPRRKAPLRLKYLDQELLNLSIPTDILYKMLEVPKIKPIDRRVAVMILGIH